MKKRRYTTYLSERHIDAFKKIYDAKGVKATSLLGMAIDRLLIESGWLEAPETPPIELSFLRRSSQDT